MVQRVQPNPRVLYICGWGRSGTTLVDRVIGQVPGFTSVGELRSLWDCDPAIHLCGCGQTVAACPLWGPLLDAISHASGYTLPSVRLLRDQTTRSRHLVALHRTARRPLAVMSKGVHPYADVLESVYRGVLAATGAGVVVDSSKHPAEALLLAQQPNVDLTVLHLVRDPRGVAFSWSGRSAVNAASPAGALDRPPARGVMSSSTWWTIWNSAIEGLIRPLLGARYVRLRYEDIMVNPTAQLGAIINRFGASADALPLVGAHQANLRPSHTVAGNPMRQQTGPIDISPDLRWRTQMSGGDRRRATWPALPLLGHYGYRMRPTAHSHRSGRPA